MWRGGGEGKGGTGRQLGSRERQREREKRQPNAVPSLTAVSPRILLLFLCYNFLRKEFIISPKRHLAARRNVISCPAGSFPFWEEDKILPIPHPRPRRWPSHCVLCSLPLDPRALNPEVNPSVKEVQVPELSYVTLHTSLVFITINPRVATLSQAARMKKRTERETQTIRQVALFPPR